MYTRLRIPSRHPPPGFSWAHGNGKWYLVVKIKNSQRHKCKTASSFSVLLSLWGVKELLGLLVPRNSLSAVNKKVVQIIPYRHRRSGDSIRFSSREDLDSASWVLFLSLTKADQILSLRIRDSCLISLHSSTEVWGGILMRHFVHSLSAPQLGC